MAGGGVTYEEATRALMAALGHLDGATVRAILDVRDGAVPVLFTARVVKPDAVDPLVALMHNMDVPTMTGGAAAPVTMPHDERAAVLALLAEMDEDAEVMEQSGDKRGQTVRGYAGRLRVALGETKEADRGE